MKLSGAQIVLTMLEKNGTTVVFGYPGAANAALYDKLPEFPIKHILVRNEQGAAHMANGYARITHKAGVCFATSGPGATNLVTGIATAYMDSVPLIAITGQVDTSLIGKDAFQEIDITGTTEPFCKHNYLVKQAKELPQVIQNAFYIATTGRPGPVLIDVPMDVLRETVEFNMPENDINIRGYKPADRGHEGQIKKALSLLSHAQKPLIMAGGGIISSDACSEFKAFYETMNIPVISTLMGISSMPTNHPLYYGMLGSHGQKVANHAINNADVILVLGSRIADRSVARPQKLSDKTSIIHIDIDPAEIGKNANAKIPIVGNIKTILSQMNTLLAQNDFGKTDITEWTDELTSHRKPTHKPIQSDGYVDPIYVLQTVSTMASPDAVFSTEVGENQIWSANNLVLNTPGTFVSSGGFGTMGYGLPAAIGAKVAAPDREVFVVLGDGSFQMSMPELGTMAQWDIPVKLILFNNHRLGMVRELQKHNYHSNYSGVFLDGSPDFCKLADAYHMKSQQICQNSEVESAITKMLQYDGSYLLEIMVDPELDCTN